MDLFTYFVINDDGLILDTYRGPDQDKPNGAIQVAEADYNAVVYPWIGYVYTAPVPPDVIGTVTPPAVPAASPAQLAVLALAAGISVSSAANNALSSTYRVDPDTRSDMLAEVVSLMRGSTFTNGETSLDWPDVSGVSHSFSVTEFNEFATAIGNRVTTLKRIARTNAGEVPSDTIMIG